jgi:hypothetical protein
MKISMTEQKRWPFHTGDCLIEDITYTGLIVLNSGLIIILFNKLWGYWKRTWIIRFRVKIGNWARSGGTILRNLRSVRQTGDVTLYKWHDVRSSDIKTLK